MYYGQGFFIALIITSVMSVISLVAHRRESGGQYTGLGITIAVAFVAVWALSTEIIWDATPARTGSMAGYAWIIWPILTAALIFFLGDYLSTENDYGDHATFSYAGIAGLVLFLIFGGYIILNQFIVRSQGDANYLGSRVTVIHEAPENYPNTVASHIIEVPVEHARYTASQVIAKETTDKNGKVVNLSSAYRIGEGELQSIQDHLYWIFALDFSSWNNWKRSGQISPGYIVVDAENPNVKGQLRNDFELKYIPSAFFESKLERYLYSHGYAEYEVDDLTLEVDDNWQPFYTASINKKTKRNGGSYPQAMIIVEPQSGKVTRLKLDEVPEWVDRIYSKETAKRMLNWWGTYGNEESAPWRFWFRPGKNQFKVSGNPVLVYTTSGHPAWQMTLTSKNNDSAITHMALFEARKSEVRLYKNIEGTFTEDRVAEVFSGISANNQRNLEAVHLSFHMVYGNPTWVANYIQISEKKSAGQSLAGMGFLRVSQQMGIPDVAFGTNKEAALDVYNRKLQSNPDASAPNEGSATDQSIRGTVKQIATQIEDGNTVYLFVLVEYPNKVFRAVRGNPELPFIKEGATVVVIYDDNDKNPIDITQVNDLSQSIVP